MMEEAIRANRNRETEKQRCGFNCGTRNYDFPRATLNWRTHGAIDHVQTFGRYVDLPEETKDELRKHVMLLSERFLGSTRNECSDRHFKWQNVAIFLIVLTGKKGRMVVNGTAESFQVILKTRRAKLQGHKVSTRNIWEVFATLLNTVDDYILHGTRIF